MAENQARRNSSRVARSGYIAPENAVVTVDLKFPKVSGGESVRSIAFRRPTLGDQIEWSKIDNPYEILAFCIQRLGNFPEAKQLDIEDTVTIADALNDFLSLLTGFARDSDSNQETPSL